MSTCNRLDLQTLGYQLVMPKNLPDHWLEVNFDDDVVDVGPFRTRELPALQD